MSVITEIKAKILQLEGGAFQELCDTYLYAKGYRKNLSLGMKAGTMKTTIGNPDTYYKTENGKYILVAYTTSQSQLFKKIEEDLQKCLDKNKTKIDILDIDKIIYCHTSSNLTAGEDKKLHGICEEKNIELELYGIDTLANEIYLYYKYIASDFLGIKIDTNQIMEIEKFEEDYNSNKMLAPLSTIFQFREEEKQELLTALNKNEVVFVTGQAGVGKTKLVLEVIKEYEKEKNNKVFCIKNKGLDIYDDLHRYIIKSGNYLLFIDDGNELQQLNQVFELAKTNNIKVIITGRNYVQKDIADKINQYNSFYLKEIKKLDDKQITEFLKVNLGIKNSDYIKQILKIANGNPRIAYMTGKIAIEKQNLSSIHNVTDLYEKYYKQSMLVTDEKMCICAGIISLYQIIELHKLENIESVLQLFNFSEEDFKENIEKLSDLEFVEINFGKVAKISDQCFANYMLFYIFIKKRKVSLSLFIELGFLEFKNYLINMLQMILNIFYSEKIIEYIEKEVKKVWNKFEEKGNYIILENFMKVFFHFDELRALTYIQEKIEKVEEKKTEINLLNFETRNMDIEDRILNLLIGYKYSKFLNEAIELVFEYGLKRTDRLPEILKMLLGNYDIDHQSEKNEYYTQKIILDKFMNYITYPEIQILFFKIAKEFLKLKFSHTKSENSKGIIFYNGIIRLDQNCKEYRKKVWDIYLKLCNYKSNSDKILENLSSLYYTDPKADRSIFEFDKEYIIKVLKNIKTDDNFEVAKVYNKFKQENELYAEDLEKFFNSFKWKIYNVLRYKRNFKLDYEEQGRIYSENILRLSQEVSIKEIPEIFEIIGSFSDENYKKIENGFNIFLNNFCSNENNLREFILYYFNSNVKLFFPPEKIIKYMMEFLGENETYKLIWNSEILNKNTWQFLFFSVLPKESLNLDYVERFLNFLKLKTDKKFIYSRRIAFLDILNKFLEISPEIYVSASKIVYLKKEYNFLIVEDYFQLLFSSFDNNTPEKLLKLYKTDLNLLKEIYFIMLDSNSDYDGKFFKKFLENDFNYLERFISNFQIKNIEYDDKISNLWLCENYIEIFDYIFDNLLNKEELKYYGFSHEILKFLTTDNFKKCCWLEHIIEKNFNNDKIFKIFEIVCQLNSELKLKCIIKFISLNQNYEIFKKINIEPSFKCFEGSEVPLLEKDKKFYEKILAELSGVKFIKHKNFINKKIELLKEKIEEEKRKDFIRETLNI